LVPTLLFYKPYGVTTQFSGNKPNLSDYIHVPGVYAAGRLDKDSEGLLVLTSDGALQHRLTHPRFGHPRTYLAQVEGVPAAGALAALRGGVKLNDFVTRPARVRLLEEEPNLPPRTPPIRFRKSVPTAWLELTLTEGKNRQVRRMTAAVGHPTLRLVRVRVGQLSLEGLVPGEWRYLRKEELATLEQPIMRDR
jgi:23S rRNA pseudouridine2457 synthase